MAMPGIHRYCSLSCIPALPISNGPSSHTETRKVSSEVTSAAWRIRRSFPFGVRRLSRPPSSGRDVPAPPPPQLDRGPEHVDGAAHHIGIDPSVEPGQPESAEAHQVYQQV